MLQNELKVEYSKIFYISYRGLELRFELFTINYIISELEKLKSDFESIHRITIQDKNNRKRIREIYMEGEQEKYHFFSYIKFFEYKEQKYGLVGGKTNYPSPDISFDYLGENDNRISRTFLNDKHLKWSKEIIILNHAPYLKKDDDERQAKFIECFLQRKFNLFDS